MTKKEASNVPIKNNFGLPWAKNMQKMDDDQVMRTFQQIITDMKWDVNDDIMAIGDDDNDFFWLDYKEFVNEECLL